MKILNKTQHYPLKTPWTNREVNTAEKHAEIVNNAKKDNNYARGNGSDKATYEKKSMIWRSIFAFNDHRKFNGAHIYSHLKLDNCPQVIKLFTSTYIIHD